MSKTEDLTVEIVSGFVSKPEAVEVQTTHETDEEGELDVIHIKVDPKDVGISIGTGGKTAEALRRIISLVGFKQEGKRVFLKIDAPKLPKNAFSV